MGGWGGIRGGGLFVCLFVCILPQLNKYLDIYIERGRRFVTSSVIRSLLDRPLL